MSGGKGGSQTTEVKIPEWLETAAKGNLARADEVARIGYTPYYGPDVAAMTPMQQAAMQNTNQGAAAFGLAAPSDPMAGMPQSQTFADGVQGYSSAPTYQQSVDQLKARNPAQYAAMMSMFIDPVTGAPPSGVFAGNTPQTGVTPLPTPPRGWASSGGSGSGSGGNSAMFSGSTGLGQTGAGSNIGGYTSLKDFFDGGGAGKSGSMFSGSPLANILNTVGVKPAGHGGSSSSMGSGK